MIEKHSTSASKDNQSNLSPECSCTKCDSINCFAIRNTKIPCTCVKCTHSKTCLYYLNKDRMDESTSDIKVNTFTRPKKKSAKERIDKEIMYDCNNDMEKDYVPNKRLKYSSKTEGFSERSIHCCIENYKPYPNFQSSSVTHSRKNINPAVANLSAQIMNVSRDDFKNSFAVDKSDSSYKGKMTLNDVLQKIKHIYQACSCKVCNCIVGNSLPTNEFSKCKFCKYNQYEISGVDHTENKLGEVQTWHYQPCGSSTYSFSLTKPCNCGSCECIKCTDSHTKSCNCQPCQCIECKTMSIHLGKTFIVAPVVEHYQGNMCQCSPCDCIDCVPRFGTSNLMHEMSTGINRHPFCNCEACVNEACEPNGSDSCECQRLNKVVRKPVEKDVQDYDIRAILTKQYSRRLNEGYIYPKSDNCTTTISPSVPNVYPKYNNYKKVCKCGQCDCLYCSCEENTINGIKYSQLYEVGALPYLKSNACKSSSCEYKVGFDNTIDERKLSRTSFDIWKCEVCNYRSINAKHKIESFDKLSKKYSSKRIYYNYSGSCLFCRADMPLPGGTLDTMCTYDGCKNYSSEIIYPIKKGKLLVPSTVIDIQSNNENKSLIDNLVSNSAWALNKDHKINAQVGLKTATNSLYCNTQNKTKNISLVSDVDIKSYMESQKCKSEDSYLKMNKGFFVGSYRDLSNDLIVFSKNNLDTDINGVIRLNQGNFLDKSHFDDDQHEPDVKLVQLMHLTSDIIVNKTHSLTKNEQLKNSYLKENCHLLNITSSYESAQNTLRNSKANSFQLLKILSKYEKFNLEFQSFSQKFKDSHKLLVDDSFKCSSDNINNIDIKENEYKSDKNSLDVLAVSNVFTLKTSEQSTMTVLHEKIKLNSKKLVDEQIIVPTTEDTNTGYLRPAIGTKELQLIETSINPSRVDIDKTKKCIDFKIVYRDPINTLLANSHRQKCATITCFRGNYTKLLRRIVKLSKKISLVRKTQIMSKGCAISKSINTTLNQIHNSKFSYGNEDKEFNKLITIRPDKLEDQNKTNAINLANFSSDKIEENIKKQDRDIIEPSKDSERVQKTGLMPIFKKNLYLEPVCVSKNKDVAIFPSLYVEYKEAVNSISLQTNADIDNKTPSFKHKSLKNLQLEVEKLLKMIILESVELSASKTDTTDISKPFETNLNRQHDLTNFTCSPVPEKNKSNIESSVETNSRMCSIQSTKSCCDGVRVSFLNLRRVSDHTVMVKWNAPRDTTDVQGYELQVDGRSVQKIFSPSQNIAVVTCLPHCEKVLLTIRTLTAAAKTSGHFPSVTVIYRPRSKIF